MKREFIYFLLIVPLLLSCSKEEIPSSLDSKEKIEMPVSIEITSGKKNESSTRADMKPGTCNVDKVLLLIYSGESTVTDRTQLTYVEQTVLDCKQENGKWVARGKVTGTVGKKYCIFALGYNDAKEKNSFSIENVTAGQTYGNAKVKLALPMADGNNTPEFFAGNVHPQGKDMVFTSEGEEALTGTLYRAVGKCAVKLTGIPANIKKLTWVSEKFAETNILYRTTGLELDKYPMGIPADDELNQTATNIASIENSITNGTWDASLDAFFIPLMKSLFFVDATDENGNTTRYLVKSADQWSLTIWLGFITYFVESYRFSVYPNFQMSIEGTFDKLRNSGNLSIDLSPMEEYDGGLLS